VASRIRPQETLLAIVEYARGREVVIVVTRQNEAVSIVIGTQDRDSTAMTARELGVEPEYA